MHQSKAEKFIHLLLLTTEPIASLRLPSEPSRRPPAVSHPSGFHSLRTGFMFHHFSQEAHLFLYNLANITRGKLSYNSGGQPGKTEKTQWVFIDVYLCMGMEAAHPPYI